ncbi:ras-related protein Rab-9A isoform X2 [Mustela lutreola]|uniref:ras-related protein Rab-9A isoform X2 n=1 Tax=Mustela lutreola TaxID=9666 RepID=UPI0027979E58|nr:ras-related protein Rab-9A isoform X2 [Mustela lutreola]
MFVCLAYILEQPKNHWTQLRTRGVANPKKIHDLARRLALAGEKVRAGRTAASRPRLPGPHRPGSASPGPAPARRHVVPLALDVSSRSCTRAELRSPGSLPPTFSPRCTRTGQSGAPRASSVWPRNNDAA